MFGFSTLDLFAIFFFAATWVGYGAVVEFMPIGKRGLNNRMHRHREAWMRQMLLRDMRMVDGQIMGSLQNGTAFFASTSLLAIGGALALLRSSRDVTEMFANLPFGAGTTPGALEMKVIGLLVIFIYAFFKFAWSYRLFNYAAILLGATPSASEAKKPPAKAAAEHVARMVTLAGRHFNRGQRSFFFALGYLGWFVGPWVLIASTLAVLIVTVARQFGADARWVIGD
ncbi:MAG TPA: DUF599 family protein [Xanthobacteraceae bacterium]|nr:DUF599 family protein [Xanthobacteraceae bacterium]